MPCRSLRRFRLNWWTNCLGRAADVASGMIAIVARRPARDAALPERALPYLKGGASISQQIPAADPLAFVLAAGQAGDAPAYTDVMARLRVPRPCAACRSKADGLPPRLPRRRRWPRWSAGTGIHRSDAALAYMFADRAGGVGPVRQNYVRSGARATSLCRTHQSPEAVARHRHTLREERDQLPGRTPHRGHFPMVSLIHRHKSSKNTWGGFKVRPRLGS